MSRLRNRFMVHVHRPEGGREAGSASLELVIWAPVILLLLAVLVLAGRVQVAASAVEHAAFSAARDASLSRSPAQARAAATAAAARELTGQGLDCTDMNVQVDTSGFAAPIGTPATVTMSLTCTLSFASLAVPGTRTITATATSPIDQWRAR